MADEEQKPQEEEQVDEPKKLTVNVGEIEDVGTLKKKVNVEIPKEEIDRKLDENYGELDTTAQIPGFRIGRAPRRLIEKRFGKDVREQVRLSLLAESIDSAIEQAELKKIGEPDVDIDAISLPDDGPLTFSFEVEVEPEFDLPELEGIEVEEKDVEVTDKDVDEQLENIRWRFAKLEECGDDAKIEKGDEVKCDLKVEVGEEAPVVRNDAEIVARVHPIEGITFEGIEEALIGAGVGDRKETEATVSKEHENEAWREKAAKLSVEVKKISKWIRPEVDDEFAAKVGFDTVKEMRDTMKTELESRKGQQVRQDLEQQIRDYVLKNTKIDLPDGLTERQTDRALQRRVVQLKQMGMPEVLIRDRVDELRSKARDTAVDDLKTMFALDKIARQYEIEVEEEEVNSVVANMAAGQGRRPEKMRQEMMQDGSYQNVFGMVRERKVVEKLLDSAKISKADTKEADEKTEKK